MEIYKEQFNTSNDFPKQTKVKYNYVIAFTPRSGSHLIGHSLHQTGQMGFPLEYFNSNNFPIWQKRFQTKGIADTLAMIKQYRTSPNGCFGCKLGYTEFEKIASECDFDELFHEFKIIRIRRKDILSQAVSLAKAKITGSFISSQKALKEPIYSYQSIDDALKEILIDNARLDYMLAKKQIPYLEIYYEDFLENPNKILQEIGHLIGIELKSNFHSHSFLLPKKQSDCSNKEFKSRFLEDNIYLKTNKDFDFLQNISQTPTNLLAKQLLFRINKKVKRTINKININSER